jgi:hypothetical protein
MKYRIALRQLSSGVQLLHTVFESGNHFDFVVVHDDNFLGINFTFAKAYVHKIGSQHWIEVDISDK